MPKPYIMFLAGLVAFPTFVSAQCAKTSLYFDGIYVDNTNSAANDHVDISTNGPMSTIESGVSYTIEAWVKRGVIDNPGGYERIISKDFIYQLRVVNNQFVGELGTSSVQTPYPADTLWHHLALVRNTAHSTLSLYIDGQLSATAPDNSTSIPNNDAMVTIGARNNGIGEISELWKGNIRWLRVSKVARYAANFVPASFYANDSQTLARWGFNTGSGTVLHDLANSHQGTIVNATWVTETETPPLPPSLSAQSTNICAGLSTQITASNCSGTLEWGTGQSDGTITVKPYATTTYAARCVSASGCASNAAELTINVEGVMPTISIVATPGTFIQKGEVVTFTATSTHGGPNPVYQWRKNGAVVGTNSPIYTDAQLNSGDSIRCILTSDAPCRQLDKVVSNEVKILIAELTTNGDCGETSLALNDLPYTEIRWKKNGQYIENLVLGSRGKGVAVAGNLSRIIPSEGGVFVNEAGAVYAPSNQGIVEIAPNGEERIILPVKRNFFRSRQGSFYIPYEDRVEKWEIGDTQGTLVAGGNGVGSNANQLSIGDTKVQTLQVTDAGVLYIADFRNKRIQRWDPGASEGVTVAQGEQVGYTLYVNENEDIFTCAWGTVFKWPRGNSTPIPLYTYNYTPTALSGDNKGNIFLLVLATVFETYLNRFNPDGATTLHHFASGNRRNNIIVYGLAISPTGEFYFNVGGFGYNGIYRFIPNQIYSKISPGANIPSPQDVFVDKQGNIFVAGNDAVQKWSPGSKQGIIVAGGNGIGGAANQLNSASDVAVDEEGTIYVADRNNYRVQKWSPGATSGVTVAGGNGSGTAANQLVSPSRIFLDAAKTLYIADGNRVQKWVANASSGVTVANGPNFGTVSSVFVKGDTLYVAGGFSVEKWVPGASSGIPLCGITDGQDSDIHVDQNNDLYFSRYDTFYSSNLVRRWSPTGEISNGCLPGKVDTLAKWPDVQAPRGIFVDSTNNLYVAELELKSITKFLATSPTLTDTTGGTYTVEVTIGTRTLTLNAAPGSNGGLCESIASGDWTNSALWTCGRVPRACDQVVINPDHTVSLAAAVQISGLEVRQNGILSLVGGNVQIAKP